MFKKLLTDFPEDFLWGAATSAFQVEGAAYDGGKGASVADIRANNSAKFLTTEVSVDHYHRVDEDVALMKELGLKAYRFSISWTRIFPNGNDVLPNQEGVAFYHQLISGLKSAGIEPIVTIFHFDFPQGLVDQYGGWENRKAIKDYCRYAEFLFKEYGNDVNYWLTVNEHSLIVNVPEMIGIKDDDKISLRTRAEQASYNIFLAQAKTFAKCQEILPNALIGPAVSYMTNLHSKPKSSEAMISKELEDMVSFITMDVAVRGEFPTYYIRMLKEKNIRINVEKDDADWFKKGRANFLGLNWYCTSIYQQNPNKTSLMLDGVMANIERIQDPDLMHTEWGFSYDPQGLRYALQIVHDRFPHLPLMITECGWSQREELTADGRIHDDMRVNFLNDHIYFMREAIRDGVNLIGFNPWSFIDLLSVNDGIEKRYGLVYVNRDNISEKDMKRYKKDSYYFYQEVIKTGGQNIGEYSKFID